MIKNDYNSVMKVKHTLLKLCFIIGIYFLTVNPINMYADFSSVLEKLTSDEHLKSLSFDNILANNKSISKKAELKKMAPLMVASTQFKKIASTDYATALLTLSKDKGMEKLHEIDTSVWDVELSQVGWNLFFDSAIHIYNKELDKYPLVAYYNPFSDTYLITVWALIGNEYKIVDAEILMGDFVRGTSKTVSNTPFWLRKNDNRTINLGISTALSILAFEEIFEKATLTDWRKKLKILQDTKGLSKFNYPNISIAFNGHLFNLINFSDPKDNDPQLQECRQMTLETIDALKRGTVDKLLAIKNNVTPVETANILKRVSPNWVDSLYVTVAINNADECLVLLTHKQQGSGNVSFLFKDKKDHLYLNRIDLIDYQQFYEAIKTYQEKKLGGVK